MSELTLNDLAIREMSLLRDELRSLKTCQFAFLTTAFTATGLLLGFVAKSIDPKYFDFVFLAPLIVILPCFCFFFDKACTITRIVGYYRVLEDRIGNGQFRGWENSLSDSRQKIEEMKIGFFDFIGRIISIRRPYGYWSLAFNTYVTLVIISILCACLYPYYMSNKIHWMALLPALALSFFCIIRNLVILRNLMIGKNCYNNNYKKWKEILEKSDTNQA